MKTLMIDKMNEEKQLVGEIIEVLEQHISPELAELKANEIMRIFGYSYSPLSADDKCPYCGMMRDEQGNCYCSFRRLLNHIKSRV